MINPNMEEGYNGVGLTRVWKALWYCRGVEMDLTNAKQTYWYEVSLKVIAAEEMGRGGGRVRAFIPLAH